MAAESTKVAFHKAFRRALRPLVRMALRRGISANDIYQWLKALYVDEAESFTIKGKKQSASRIAVLTGLDRKEVARLRALNEDVEALLLEQAGKTNRALRAINAWKTDADYLEGDTPKVIPLYGGKGSFEWLIKEYCGDVTMMSVLGELQQSGLVEIAGEGMLVLRKQNYIPESDDSDMLALMGDAAGDLLSTAEHNLERTEDVASRLQLSAVYTDFDEETLNKFKKLVDKDSGALLEKVDHWVRTELSLREETVTTPRRAGLGIYYFEDSTHSGDNDNE